MQLTTQKKWRSALSLVHGRSQLVISPRKPARGLLFDSPSTTPHSPTRPYPSPSIVLYKGARSNSVVDRSETYYVVTTISFLVHLITPGNRSYIASLTSSILSGTQTHLHFLRCRYNYYRPRRRLSRLDPAQRLCSTPR